MASARPVGMRVHPDRGYGFGVSNPTDRMTGPWDESEIDPGDGVERLDLGGLLITATPGIDVQVQVDENTGKVALVTFSTKAGAVQVQPYAAPKTGGMWQDVRAQISASISGSGGVVDEVTGPFGTELHAQVKGGDTGALQPARFVGVDGPRWFLRAVFLGGAARPGAAADPLEAMVRSVVVVRGLGAMPVGSPIPLRLPDAAAPSDVPVGKPTISPFARGPEITETR